jgi:chromosomal replication initiator protein
MVSDVFTLSLPSSLRSLGQRAPRRPAGPTLPEFIAGPENVLARSAAQALLDPHGSFSPLVIYGPPGSGKTHLALGLAALWKQQFPSRTLLVTDGNEFAQDLAIAAHSQGLGDFRRRLSQTHLIVIDDLDALSKKQSSQTELLRLLDSNQPPQRQVMVTIRELTAGHADLLPGLASRLLGGLAIRLQLPEIDARDELVTRFAAQLSAELTPDQSRALAAALPLAPGPLAAVISRIVNEASASGKPIDDRTIVSCSNRQPQPATPSLSDVTAVVASRFGMTPAELKGPSRRQAVAHARAMAMYLARQLTTKTMTEIGHHFGGRDHTTVIHACRVNQLRIQTDPAVRQAADVLVQKLTGA